MWGKGQKIEAFHVKRNLHVIVVYRNVIVVYMLLCLKLSSVEI